MRYVADGKSLQSYDVILEYSIILLSEYALAASLHGAAEEANLAKLKCLIEGSGDVDVRGENGVTPLHWAADQGHWDLVKMHISKGANVNAVTLFGILHPRELLIGSRAQEKISLGRIHLRCQ